MLESEDRRPIQTRRPEYGAVTRQRLFRAAFVAAIGLAALSAIGVKVGPETYAALAYNADIRAAPVVAGRPIVGVSEAAVSTSAAYDALADMPYAMLEALTAAETQGGQPFRFLVAVPPAEICTAMDTAGLDNPGWAAAGEGWECASDLVPLPGSVPSSLDPDLVEAGLAPEPRPSTIFFTARGPQEDHLGIVRFKLNLDDPSVDQSGRELLLRALDRLSGPLAWSIPKEMETAIRKHRKLSAFDRGIAIEVHPESDPIRRLNVVLLLETPAARLPADHFQTLPPAEAERLAR